MSEISLIIPISFGIAFFLAWGIGGNNGTMAPLAGIGVVTVKKAVILGAIMAFLGAVIFGYNVEKTIGRNLFLNEINSTDVFIMLFSMASWSILASYKGWPISATHSGVGVAIGLGLIKWSFGGLNWIVLIDIAIIWFLSPLMGLFGAIAIVKIIRFFRLRHVAGLEREMKIARLSAIPLLVWSCVYAFSWGANNIATATAFLSVTYGNSVFVRAVVGAGMLLGSIILSSKVTKSIGLKLVKLDPLMALSASLTVALIMLFATILGLPVSGTHTMVGSIIGVGSARGTWINIKRLNQIVVTWLATFFITLTTCVMVFLVISNSFI